MFISGQSEKKGGERGSDRSGKEKFYEENKGETHGYNLETKMDILAAAGSDAAVLPGKTFAAEKESREAEDSYIYHTAFDAKASLKIRHMKDYGVLDYEETVTVEDSCDYLDGDENLDEIQAKITAYDEKVQKVCEGMQVVSGTDTRGIDGDTINIEYEDTEENGQTVTTRHFYQTYKIRTDWVLEKMEISDVNIVNSTLSCYAGDAPKQPPKR